MAGKNEGQEGSLPSLLGSFQLLSDREWNETCERTGCEDSCEHVTKRGSNKS